MKAKTANMRRLDILGNGDFSEDREILTALPKRWRRKLGYCSIFAAAPAMLVANIQASRADEANEPEASITGQSVRFLERLNNSRRNRALLKRQSKFRLPHQTRNYNWLIALAGNDDCPGRAIPGGNYTAAAPYIDSGITTGANNTITNLVYWGYYNSAGPDHIYSFVLSDRGPNPEIKVSTTSSTYRPLIYVLFSESAGACPAGTGNVVDLTGAMDDTRLTNGSTATIVSASMSFFPLHVPLYLFVDSALNDASGSGPYTLRLQDVSISPVASNSIDSAELFVRQHYLDFLNRDPDAAGLAYWTNQITQCGNDAACIHRRRVGVSAAFFMEPEFQETGYYIYRLYKASFGRQPNYNEFRSDRWRFTAFPNDLSKERFATEWVQRPDFVAAYPATMSNTEFVNKVFDFARLTASRYQPLRQQEILAMNAGRSRALVLRDVIEIPDFRNIPEPNDPRYSELKQISQYNPAFVLMQYFGYLRRDLDADGYAFWLDVVNDREPNNYSGMVCAFITSAEYQQRFGLVVTRSNADCGQ